MLMIGIVGLAIGAKYLIDSIVALSAILNIATGVIAITAVAFGTSLPELIVSVKAAMRRQSEIALGNIFGSNIFNVLAVVGLPGMFGTIYLDEKTLMIGLPVLAIATLLFIISGISRRIHMQEGALFVLLYIMFVTKLFDLF
jgi:cation:H+ antiporter